MGADGGPAYRCMSVPCFSAWPTVNDRIVAAAGFPGKLQRACWSGHGERGGVSEERRGEGGIVRVGVSRGSGLSGLVYLAVIWKKTQMDGREEVPPGNEIRRADVRVQRQQQKYSKSGFCLVWNTEDQYGIVAESCSHAPGGWRDIREASHEGLPPQTPGSLLSWAYQATAPVGIRRSSIDGGIR